MRTCILFLLPIVLVACQAKREPSPPAFVKVQIESHPQGWGYAHKTVTPDGVVEGGHLSGGPNQPFVHQSQGRMSAEDMAALSRYVAGVHALTPGQPVPLDQNAEGYTSVTIVTQGGARAFVAKWGKPFQSPDLQAIWDLLAKYPAGAW